MNNQVLFTEKEIQNKVKELANIINAKKHESTPVFICILNGAFMFFTDLVKNIDNCHIDFIRAQSYTNTTQGKVNITKPIEIDITGRDVYLVDDIYDSGNTINNVIKYLNQYNPNTITPVTLFKRHTSQTPNLIYGFNLENEYFLIGYGLDNNDGTKRNQKYITGLMNDD
jgi:hypoxanthine phosphoribosyltransferase